LRYVFGIKEDCNGKEAIQAWKLADIIPQPTAPVSEVVRAALTHLPDADHLEEE
jgi:hypothetical protein